MDDALYTVRVYYILFYIVKSDDLYVGIKLCKVTAQIELKFEILFFIQI